MAPKAFRERLREKYVPKLTAIIGKVYRDAVCACLNETLKRDKHSSLSEDSNKKIFHKFVEKIAKPLEELSQLRI
jgi:hypothetical protein